MAAVSANEVAVEVVDLETSSLRELNQRLHDLVHAPGPAAWRLVNPNGAHALACGVDADVEVEIEGHVGYYCAGMNKRATVRVHGNAGPGVAENIMSGRVVVDGNASQSAGATGHGGLLVVHGDASARCGISMKGLDIVVRGSVGHLSGFMAQTGRLVVCGDAGEALRLTGPPTVLEGRFGFLQAFCGDRAHPDAVVRGLGTDWELPRVVFKPYPCNHFTHAGVDVTLRLRAQGLAPADVTAIELGVAKPVLRTIAEPPEARPASGYHVGWFAVWFRTRRKRRPSTSASSSTWGVNIASMAARGWMWFAASSAAGEKHSEVRGPMPEV